MNVSLIRSYRSRNGNNTFVYAVNTNAKDLETYKAAQGDFYRESDSGQPLWFTTKCIGQSGKLIITTNGKVVPDMSQYDQAASLAAQYGGNFGQELAKATVAKLLGTTTVADAPAVVATPVATIAVVEPEEDLSKS